MTDKTEIKDEDLVPEDTKAKIGDYILGVDKLPKVAQDKAMAEKVARYVGHERRENLDKEIEQLYDTVAAQLDRPEEVTAAFRILREAQDIIFEDTRQYDEALYRVATVKAMLSHKRHLVQWSYTWGLFVFFYALIWFIAAVAGLLFRDQLGAVLGQASDVVNVIRGGWLSAAAGVIGSVCGILYSLYWHVSYQRDFDRQYMMYYLVQPILGFTLGAVIYFIIAAGFLTVGQGALLDQLQVVAIYVVLGFLAGFRQKIVLEMIEKIIRRIVGTSGETPTPPSPPVAASTATQPIAAEPKK